MSGSLAAKLQSLSPEKRPRLLSTKEEKIDELLDHFTDIQQTTFGRGGVGMGEGGVIQMPEAWNQSYRELDRCLIRMRGLAADDVTPSFRRSYLHLRGWYLTPKIRFRYRKVRKVHGKMVESFEPAGEPRDRVKLIDRQGHPSLVLMAVAWIGLEFQGEPFTPKCKGCKKDVWACECVSAQAA